MLIYNNLQYAFHYFAKNFKKYFRRKIDKINSCIIDESLQHAEELYLRFQGILQRSYKQASHTIQTCWYFGCFQDT